jgi:hypothetical protein
MNPDGSPLHPSSFIFHPFEEVAAMIKCPFCHFDNEDGALFCDQCKSDLSTVAPTPVVRVPAVPAVAVPVVAEAVPVLAEPIDVEPMLAEAVPVDPAVPSFSLESATPMVVEALPVEAMPVEAMPVEDVPVEVLPVEVLPVDVVPVMATPVVATPVLATPVPVPTPVPVTPQPVMPQPVSPAAPTGATPLPAGSQPRLLVLRGVKRNVEYPIFEGQNFVGRADEKPVDIDLEEQEPPDRIWCSRQHCVLFYENNELSIEDLNSSNGTFVNRVRLYPGQKKMLAVNDVIQIGNVQMKVVV